MIVIDTNVVSEMMRAEPNRQVLAWSETVRDLYTTAITLAEVNHGIARLPNGRRKERLVTTAAQIFADFDDVILAFDAPAGHQYAEIVANREQVGRPITIADAQIAAICASRQAQLATRNTGDFDATGISVINPWN